MRRVAVVGLLSLLLGLDATPARAAPDHRAVAIAGVPVGTDGERLDRIRAAIDTRRAALGLPGDRLTLTARARSGAPEHAEVVWIEGHHDTIPVLGPVARAVVVRGELRLVLPTTLGPLPAAAAQPPITRDDALARVAASGLPGSTGASDARLVVLPGNTPRTVWLVDPPAALAQGTNPVFAVDASTGSVRVVADRVRTALARAFYRNPSRDPVAGDYPLIQIDPDAQVLEGPFFRSVNCAPNVFGGCTLESTAFANAQGDFLYPAPDVSVFDDNVQYQDEFAEVSMYYHADKFLVWMQGMGFGSLICHQQGRQAVLVANFVPTGEPWFNNAFYSGDCDRTMVFGQGSEVDFAYDGDVVYHELGHGVVEAQQDGGFLGWPNERRDALLQDAGAINEAFADFVSSAFAQDSVVGDYISDYWSALPGPGVRDNDNRYVCPDDIVGEVHVDSEPLGGALWDTYRVFGEVAVTLALDTVAALPNDASLEEATSVFYTLAQGRLSADAVNVVAEIFSRRGLFDCPRFVAHDGMRMRMFVQPAEDYQPFPPPPLQLTVDVPVDANTIDLSFTYDIYEGSFDSGGVAVPNVLVKRGAPIAFTYDDSTAPTTVTHDADQMIAQVTDGDLRIKNARDTTVYLGFVNTGDQVMTIDDVSVELSEQDDDETDTGEPEPPPPPLPPDPGPGTDTGTDDTAGQDDGKKGCGCAATSPGGSTLAGLALLALAGGRRRRRR